MTANYRDISELLYLFIIVSESIFQCKEINFPNFNAVGLQPSTGCIVASTGATKLLLFLYIQSSGEILWNVLVIQT